MGVNGLEVGVFGGTFDPIHLGHLIVAEEVRIYLALREILFVPAGQPWFKVERQITPANHRVRMIELAIASNSCFHLSTLEVDREGYSYTVDTMMELRGVYGEEVEMFFILGMDTLRGVPEWKNPDRLVRSCRLVVVTRPGEEGWWVPTLEESIPGIVDRLLLVNVPEIDISSTQVRYRVAQGMSIRYLVPEEVQRYIQKNGLYQP